MSKVIIGVDPGLGGAIAVLKEDYSFVDVLDMPIELKKSGKRQVDPIALVGIFERYHGQAYTLIEQVSARPGQGVSSMFGLGDSYGCARAAAAGVGRLSYVAPITWKKVMKLTDNKAYSLSLARRYYPEIAESHLARKKDEGRAEALLLTRFAVQLFDTHF